MSTALKDRLQAALAGRYLIERELGRGGMATVYLARDPRHDRLVALKVLHPDLAAALGSERFLAEIRTTANLHHPHILPLHDSGEADSQLYYVMPFVEGETLRDRLERARPLPIGESIRLAREAASALDYAHRHGVIHRDVKPENILLHDGSALVADFGIALAVQAAGGGRMTQTGLSLGTPQYMSPEQAMSERTIDARSDIYSLGAVLYEMLTGDPPFTGSSVQAIVAKVMTARPTAPRVTRDTVPMHLDEAVMTALAKLPADRFATAAEFSLALTSDGGDTSSSDAVSSVGRTPSSSRWLRPAAIPWGIAAAALIFAGVRSFRGADEPAVSPVVRTELELQSGEQLINSASTLALSPQGDRVAYSSQGPDGVRLYVRRTDEFTSRTIVVGSPEAYAFSPDGRWLVYSTEREVRKVPSDGGPSVTIGTIPAVISGLAWGSPGEIVVGSSQGLWRISAAGGVPRQVSSVDATKAATLPMFVDDGTTVVYRRGGNESTRPELAVTSLSSGAPVGLGVQGAVPRGIVDGHLIYTLREGGLIAVPFDARGRKFTGEPVQLMDRVTGVAVSASGTLAFVQAQLNSQMVMAGGGADVPVMSEARRYVAPRFSPDGRKIAVVVGTPASYQNQGDIWVYDIAARTFTQVSTDGPVNGTPEWSPDGTRVLYRHSDLRGDRSMWWRSVDGSGPAQPMDRNPGSINEGLISPDGKWFVYRTSPSGANSRDIFAVPLDGEPKPVLSLVVGPEAAMMPRISPDGKWLAFVSDQSGRNEIYVQPFPNQGARIQVTTEGGTEPLWSRSGKALIYRALDAVVSVPVSTSPSFTMGERRTLVTGNYLTETTHQDYDISPDGTQLLMLKAMEASRNAVIVHNWRREFREKLANGRN